MIQHCYPNYCYHSRHDGPSCYQSYRQIFMLLQTVKTVTSLVKATGTLDLIDDARIRVHIDFNFNFFSRNIIAKTESWITATQLCDEIVLK